MKSEFRCSEAARAACEFRKICGEEATFFEGSQCYDFNKEIESKAIMKTNADRIRAMSDYDLAKFLCGLMTADNCWTTCPASEFCYKAHNGMQDWLMQPADADNHD